MDRNVARSHYINAIYVVIFCDFANFAKCDISGDFQTL